MPTTAFRTFSAKRLQPIKNPEGAQSEVIRLKPSTTFAAFTIVGPITASPGTYGPYASGNVDGSQNATHILQYACVTDASGNVTKGDGSTGNEWGATELGAPAYRSGYFASEDIANMDAGLASAKRIIVEQGDITTGKFMFLGV